MIPDINILDYKEIDISIIKFDTPNKIKGGSYMSIASYNDKPIYIQTPRLCNNKGIVKNEVRCNLELELDKFDVYHFESGMDFLKNESFVKDLKKKNKKILCHYHGEDLRSRGVMPFIDQVSSLNLTNELDLLDKHPNLKYLFLHPQ